MSKINGIEDVLQELDSKIGIDKVEANMQRAVLLVERTAREYAPKDDGGELRRSITSIVTAENGEVTGKVYSPLEYAPYIEYGTGIFAENGDGRKEVPWVYIEGSGSGGTHKKTIHTQESAERAVAYLQSKGLDARITSGREPQPYLRPALEDNRLKIIMELQKGLLDND